MRPQRQVGLLLEAGDDIVARGIDVRFARSARGSGQERGRVGGCVVEFFLQWAEEAAVSRRRTVGVVVGVFAIVGFSVGVASGAVARQGVRPSAGSYAGATSESGTVAFKVVSGGERLTGFTTTDGYNRQCKFSGGVGGIPTFTVKIPSIKIISGGLFTATTHVRLGPFKATLKVSGKFTAAGATGTVDKPGNTCGTGAANPTAHPYRETFTAKRS